MDYKTTLNLPKTAFPMRANLPENEPKRLAQWEESRFYQGLLEHGQGKPPFILHDGPPYANGDIHIGHALNKILKDLVVRYQSSRGKHTPFIPGWDCHGLPIEYQLMKELGVTKHQVDRVAFRKKARAFALKFVETQREQFKRLGCLGDWDNPYLTLEPAYVGETLRALWALVRKGFVYRDRRPVNWCWSCETALAEAEVEYEDYASPSVFVKFELDKESAQSLLSGVAGPETQVYLVIWTTTPWTLMGNVAVAVHPKFKYAVHRAGTDELWVTASNLPAQSVKALGLKPTDKPIRELSGKEMEGWRYQHPMGLGAGQVVLADYVTAEEGTGLVHTAPGFGAEDYATGKKYKLEVLAPVNVQGRFADLPKAVSGLNGKQVQEANPEIVALLERSGHLIKAQEVPHQYPHCWRCRQPIIFRATDQWFLKVDQAGLREKLLKAIKSEVNWIPAAGRERIDAMVAGRPDWCLSRQRLWGIPIPAVTCRACGEATLDPKVIENFAGTILLDSEGSDRWFTESVDRWLPENFQCQCGGIQFETGTDILDVWFDSGMSHRSVLGTREELSFPADMYLEGSDQHRGWFQVSLITAMALEGRSPYRSVLTHGFVVDGEGRKMSKSLGNVIAPQEVVSSRGADVLRLWVASSDYREDVRLSEEILSQVTEMYRKIRNTLRFCIANVADFDPSKHAVSPSKLEEMDRWILSSLGGLVEGITAAYDQYAFHRVAKGIYEFSTLKLSNVYLDVIKDRLYTAHPDDPKRRSIQTTLYQLASALIRMLAPILPITAEEAWAALPGKGEGPKASVHLADWPDAAGFARDLRLEESWTRMLKLRDQAMKALEEARTNGQIGDPLEAQLEIEVGADALWSFLEPRQKQFASSCIVSALRIGRGKSDTPEVTMKVSKAPGAKCQRCWMRLESVGKDTEHPALCHRCVEVLKRLGTGR